MVFGEQSDARFDLAQRHRFVVKFWPPAEMWKSESDTEVESTYNSEDSFSFGGVQPEGRVQFVGSIGSIWLLRQAVQYASR